MIFFPLFLVFSSSSVPSLPPLLLHLHTYKSTLFKVDKYCCKRRNESLSREGGERERRGEKIDRAFALMATEMTREETRLQRRRRRRERRSWENNEISVRSNCRFVLAMNSESEKEEEEEISKFWKEEGAVAKKGGRRREKIF